MNHLDNKKKIRKINKKKDKHKTKSQPKSLKFDFDEDINPIPGSLKNSSSVRSPNFPHQKLKMLGIKFCFDRKMRPSMES